MKVSKHRLFILLFVLDCFVTYSQGGWKKQYPLQNSPVSVCRNVIQAPNGNLLMVGLTYSAQGNFGSNLLTLVATDSVGNTLWRKDYGNYKFEYLDNWFAPQAAIVQEGNFFYHTIGVRDSNNNQIGVLIKFDYNGDTLWQKIYRETSPQDFIPQGICKSVDGGLLITGTSQIPNGRNCLVMKTDINGNELWRKKISKAVPNTQDGKSIVQDSASKKIVIVGYQYIGSSTYQETFSNILILDSLGNKILQTTFNNADGGGFSQVIQLKDKNFLACGTLNANSDIGIWPRCKNMAVKFDISGNVIWSKTYDTLALTTVLAYMSECSDSSIVMVGAIDTLHNYNISGPVKIKIYKIDARGNLKWKKYIGSAYTYTSSEFARSLNKLKDKGFVLSAQMAKTPNGFQVPYNVIKIDSTGCDTLESWCVSVALGITNFNKLSGFNFDVFPNPSSDFVNFKIDAPSDKNFNIRITEASGKEIDELKINPGQDAGLNTSGYKAGVYFVNILYEGKSIETRKLVIVH